MPLNQSGSHGGHGGHGNQGHGGAGGAGGAGGQGTRGSHGPAKPVDDDELLADAIPIDSLEEEEEPKPKVHEKPKPDADELAPIDMAEESPVPAAEKPKITKMSYGAKHEDKWNRSPNLTKHGAIHAKTFVSKLRMDAIENMDTQINEWLDAHPQYEVKFCSSAVGVLVGKISEQALFVTVWV